MFTITKLAKENKRLEQENAVLREELIQTKHSLEDAEVSAKWAEHLSEKKDAFLKSLEEVAKPFASKREFCWSKSPMACETHTEDGKTIYQVGKGWCQLCGELLDPVEFDTPEAALAYTLSAAIALKVKSPIVDVHRDCYRDYVQNECM